jgi:hypothetical protein
VRTRAIVSLLALALIAGCGGDGGGDEPRTGPFGGTTTTQAEPRPPAERPADEGGTEAREPGPSAEKRLERTPRSLAACIRDDERVAEAIVKGRKSEDATYFADLVGSRVDVLGVTLKGEGAEHSVFLFKDEAAARKAAPGAGGEGFEVQLRGAALVVAPPRADTGPIADCLGATGYARG